ESVKAAGKRDRCFLVAGDHARPNPEESVRALDELGAVLCVAHGARAHDIESVYRVSSDLVRVAPNTRERPLDGLGRERARTIHALPQARDLRAFHERNESPLLVAFGDE